MIALSPHGAPMAPPPFDRSPIGMPPAWVRTILQMAAVRIREENMRRDRKMEVRCIADALEEFAEGWDEAGKKFIDEAVALRERGA